MDDVGIPGMEWALNCIGCQLLSSTEFSLTFRNHNYTVRLEEQVITTKVYGLRTIYLL